MTVVDPAMTEYFERAPNAIAQPQSGNDSRNPETEQPAHFALSNTACVHAPSGFFVMTGSDAPDISTPTVRS